MGGGGLRRANLRGQKENDGVGLLEGADDSVAGQLGDPLRAEALPVGVLVNNQAESSAEECQSPLTSEDVM